MIHMKVLKNWKKPSASCPADFQLQAGGASTPLVNYSLINTDDYTDIPETHLEDVDAEHINGLVGTEVTKIITLSLPKVIFWQSVNHKNRVCREDNVVFLCNINWLVTKIPAPRGM